MYDTYETSNHGGRPIVLYQFRWGNTFWRYTSADSVQTYTDKDGKRNDFLPVSIGDQGMSQGGSSENDFLVNVQSDIPLVALFAESPPTQPVHIIVRRKHADDPDTEAPVYFVGRATNVVRGENPAEAEVRCLSIGSLLKSGGLRLTWGKNCPHCIYDSACKVPQDLHRYPFVVSAVNGFVVTFATVPTVPATIPAPVPAMPTEGTFTGGYIEWDRDGLGTMEKRGIEAQISTTQVKVLGRLPPLPVGTKINLYPGCDQTGSTCEGGFDNLPNMGGYPFMVEKSPFDGSQVFS